VSKRDAARSHRQDGGSRDSGNAPLIVGALRILLGAWFRIERFVDSNSRLVWPVVVIGLGDVLGIGAMRRGER
jgi:hypothetical protein